MSASRSATFRSSLFCMAALTALGGVCVYFGVALGVRWFYAAAVPSACGVLGIGAYEWLRRPGRVGAGEIQDA